MNPGRKQNTVTWLSMAGAVFLLLLVQTAFWPGFLEKRGLVPHLAVPPMLYFSLNCGAAPALWLALWASLFAGALSSLPMSYLAPAWLLLCASAWAGQALYFKKKGHLFFGLSFAWGFLFAALPLAGGGGYIQNGGAALTEAAAWLAPAIATLAAAALMAPALKILLKPESRF